MADKREEDAAIVRRAPSDHSTLLHLNIETLKA
jgi:hypothetical protein